MGWGMSMGIGWAMSGLRSDGLVPINTSPPVISGLLSVGQTLTSTTGSWTSDTPITGYLYQWYRSGTIIVGQTSNTYVLTTADNLYNITSKVAATDNDGTSGYTSSNSLFISTIPDFKARVYADTGLYQAEACQMATLTNLNNI